MKPSALLPSLAAVAMSAFPFPAVSQAQDGAGADPLAAYRTRNRVLLVFAATEQDAAYKEQTKLWQPEKTGFEERQLVVHPVLESAKLPGGESPGALAKRFGVEPKGFAVVLLGKDGHEAFRAGKPVPAATLYGVIDAMVMRRAEMKRQKAAAGASPTGRPGKPDLDHDE